MTIWRRYAQVGAALGIIAGPAILAWAIERPAGAPAIAEPPAQAQAAKPAPAASATLAAWSDAFANVAQTVRPAVVFIRADMRPQTASSRQRGGERGDPFEDMFRQFERQNPGMPFGMDPRGQVQRSSGTGFIISNDGYILTNSHVVRDADRLTVRLFDNRTYAAKVVGRDAATDVAVIRIDAKGLPAVTFGNSDSSRVGEWVLAIGNPMGEELSFTVTAGIISAKGRGLTGLPTESRYGIQDFIQTDAAINPGNSGGPLVNAEGRVIGVNSAIASQTGSYEGYGFAIPSNLARRVVDELIAHGKVTRAILGLTIRPVDPEDAEYAKLEKVTGVVVQDFSENSPAQQAGVQPGDVVVAVNGVPVEYVAQFQQSVAFRKPGEEVTLTVQRKGGERVNLKVRLQAAPSDSAAPTRAATRGSSSGQLYGSKLGVSVEPAQNGDNGMAGLVVTSVDPDGPAQDKLVPAEASPRSPDVITHVNGEKVATVDDLNRALRDTRPGEVISLRVYNQQMDQQRGGSRIVRMRIK
jgi:serine protease Do